MPGNLLTQLLGQTEQVRDLIDKSAEELSSVSGDIEHALVNTEALPGVITADEKKAAITRKLQDASRSLTAVNQALQIEIRDRRRRMLYEFLTSNRQQLISLCLEELPSLTDRTLPLLHAPSAN